MAYSARFRRAAITLWLCILVVTHEQNPCNNNDFCSCNQMNMSCDLTQPPGHVLARNTTLNTLRLTAGPNSAVAEAKFDHVNVRHVIISGSSTSRLDCYILLGITGLESLTVQYTRLSAVPRCSLKESTNVTSLTLSNNNIRVLLRGDFSVTPNLENLDLSGNCISSIGNETFKRLPHLESLGLSDNCLSGKISSAIFGSLRNLKELNLRNNKISTVEGEVWATLGELKFLDLSKNQISVLSNMHFRIRDSLCLILAHNRITTAKDIQVEFLHTNNMTSNLTLHLDVSQNDLQNFHGVHVKGPSLCRLNVDLNLDNNSIGLIDSYPVRSNACESNIHLRLLMSYNSLTSFPSCHRFILQKFQFKLLNLSHNSITGSVNELCGIAEVETADLSYNSLDAIGRITPINKQARMKYLLVAGNKITRVDKDDFEEFHSPLEFLDLSYNFVSSIEDLIQHISSSVSKLRVSNNPFECYWNETDVNSNDLCSFLNIIDDARCSSPDNLRAYQLKCVLSDNCSRSTETDICFRDSYAEAQLSAQHSARGLHLTWNLIGPGKGRVNEFLLEIFRLPNGIKQPLIHVHRLARNISIPVLEFDKRHKICMYLVVDNSSVIYSTCVTTNATPLYVPPPGVNYMERFRSATIVLGTVLGLFVLVCIVYFIFRCNVAKRNQTNPKEVHGCVMELTGGQRQEKPPSPVLRHSLYTEGPSSSPKPSLHGELYSDMPEIEESVPENIPCTQMRNGYLTPNVPECNSVHSDNEAETEIHQESNLPPRSCDANDLSLTNENESSNTSCYPKEIDLLYYSCRQGDVNHNGCGSATKLGATYKSPRRHSDSSNVSITRCSQEGPINSSQLSEKHDSTLGSSTGLKERSCHCDTGETSHHTLPSGYSEWPLRCLNGCYNNIGNNITASSLNEELCGTGSDSHQLKGDALYLVEAENPKPLMEIVQVCQDGDCVKRRKLSNMDKNKRRSATESDSYDSTKSDLRFQNPSDESLQVEVSLTDDNHSFINHGYVESEA